MEEKTFKARISNIKLDVAIRSEVFQIRESIGISGVMSHIQKIHQHSSYELFMVLDGSLTVSDEHESRDYANSVLIIPPYYNHYTFSSIKKGYGFYFSISEISKENANLFTAVQDKLANRITSFAPDESTVFYIERLSENLGRKGAENNCIHLISLLFSNLFDQLGVSAEHEKISSAKAKYRSYIHDIDAYLAKHFCDKLLLRDLAEELYLCPKQVSRIIKKEYGCSFPELINKKRLTVACMLLKHTNLSIKQIASTVGYEYENYFYKIFRETYSINPAQYRKENFIEKSAE